MQISSVHAQGPYGSAVFNLVETILIKASLGANTKVDIVGIGSHTKTDCPNHFGFCDCVRMLALECIDNRTTTSSFLLSVKRQV